MDLPDKTYYLCDPEKNAACPKTHCKFRSHDGFCDKTTYEEYAALDQGGKPIVVKTREEWLQQVSRDNPLSL